MFRRTRKRGTRGELSPVVMRPRKGGGNRGFTPQPFLPSTPKPKSRGSFATAQKRALPNSAPRWLLRIGIGFVQGLALAALFLGHDYGLWPAREPLLATAALLAILIAPLALLEALDQVAAQLLLLWSGTLGFALATLGLWQQWRGGFAWLPIAAIALSVFLAHVTLRASLRAGRAWPGYGVWTAAAWTIAARLLVWGVTAGLSFFVLAALNSVFGWFLQGNPVFRNAALLVSMPLMGMASAAGFALAAEGQVQMRARSALLLSFAVALPVLSITALALTALYFTRFGVLPIALLLVVAALVIAVHAFDWRQVPRRWHMVSLGFFAFVILESTLIASLNLHARVAAHGWTDMRIYAAVATTVLALYGLVCLAESFSALRGARSLKVLDRAVPLLALLVAIICLMLSSPFADPLVLAVKSQVARFKGSPAHFDYAWLDNHGGPFGQDALGQLPSRPAPAPIVPARAPKIPSKAPPHSGPYTLPPAAKPAPLPVVIYGSPPPASARREPAGDIIQHGAGEFPVELLTQNWSRTDAAPCLTKASIACDLWFLDLDGDGRNELLFAYGEGMRVKANVMRRARGHWVEAAAAASPPCPGLLARVRSRGALTGGLLRGWREALRAGLAQRPGERPAELPCPRD